MSGIELWWYICVVYSSILGIFDVCGGGVHIRGRG